MVHDDDEVAAEEGQITPKSLIFSSYTFLEITSKSEAKITKSPKNHTRKSHTKLLKNY